MHKIIVINNNKHSYTQKMSKNGQKWVKKGGCFWGQNLHVKFGVGGGPDKGKKRAAYKANCTKKCKSAKKV